MNVARQSCEQGSLVGLGGYPTTVTPPLGSDPLKPHPFSRATKKGIGKFVLSVFGSWSTMGFYGLILLGSGMLFFFREDIGRLIATDDATVIKKVVIEDATIEPSLIFRE